jgi:hypothetical protein
MDATRDLRKMLDFTTAMYHNYVRREFPNQGDKKIGFGGEF